MSNFVREEVVPAGSIFPSQDVVGGEYVGQIMRDVQFESCLIQDADFTMSHLQGVNFSGAKLQGVAFHSVFLENCNIEGADFEDVKMGGLASRGLIGNPKSLPEGWVVESGVLVGPSADLSKSTGASIDFARAVQRGAILRNIKTAGQLAEPLSLPDGWSFHNGYLVGPNADLMEADLRNLNIEGVDLSHAWLPFVRSGNIQGKPASLPDGWIIQNGYLIGPGADLRDVDIRGFELRDAVLQDHMGSVLSGGMIGPPNSLPDGWLFGNGFLFGARSDFSGADLTGLDLSSVELEFMNGPVVRDLSGNPTALPSGWVVVNGFLAGPTACLTGADLTDADLSKAELLLSSGGIVGMPAKMPEDWTVRDGLLIGPKAQFWSMTLIDLNLTNVNLSKACFSLTSLVRVDFSGSNLSQSEFSWATLEDLNFADTNLDYADFRGATIVSESNFDGASLQGCKFDD